MKSDQDIRGRGMQPDIIQPENDAGRSRYGQLSFDETLRHSYQREDERYSGRSQATDWLILIGIGVVQFLWMLVVFLVEPGIR
jgi:hypothetical protein